MLKKGDSMNLYELLKENRYKAKDLAEACGVTPAAVTHWMNGTCMPSVENLKKIAQFFNVTLDELIGANNDEGRV